MQQPMKRGIIRLAVCEISCGMWVHEMRAVYAYVSRSDTVREAIWADFIHFNTPSTRLHRKQDEFLLEKWLPTAHTLHKVTSSKLIFLEEKCSQSARNHFFTKK